MQIIRTKLELCNLSKELHSKGMSVGLVPTMGALHNGHMALVERSAKENDVCIVSVFVNPIQFNNKTDLEKYPRCLEEDVKLLEKQGCAYVFAPSVEEMYPQGEEIESYDFGFLETVMEGAKRPGHFGGVGVIVGRLLRMCEPTRAYFGEKDFQQCLIVIDLVKQLALEVDIVLCPIVRAEDGLAMSSRNMLLGEADRKIAPKIYQSLLWSKENAKNMGVMELKEAVCKKIAEEKAFELEYFEIANSKTLESIDTWSECEEAIGCIVVHLGGVRLIDNIRY